jgi:hypothetical protein
MSEDGRPNDRRHLIEGLRHVEELRDALTGTLGA